MSLNYSCCSIAAAKVLFVQPGSLKLHASTRYVVCKSATFSEEPHSPRVYKTFTLLLKQQRLDLIHRLFQHPPAVAVSSNTTVFLKKESACRRPACQQHPVLCSVMSAQAREQLLDGQPMCVLLLLITSTAYRQQHLCFCLDAFHAVSYCITLTSIITGIL